MKVYCNDKKKPKVEFDYCYICPSQIKDGVSYPEIMDDEHSERNGEDILSNEYVHMLGYVET